MTRLSINVNKIALIRNSRGRDFPNLEYFVEELLKLGVNGITVHPRPDERHIKYSDVYQISKIIKKYPGVELNIEGYPDKKFIKLIKEIIPHQITLVPDHPTQLTSDHGWDLTDPAIIVAAVKELSDVSSRLALFIEPNKDDASLAKQIGVDAVEIYTEQYANCTVKEDIEQAVKLVAETSIVAKKEGLVVNAGHDLSLENLDLLLNSCSIDEVSIGHSFTVECIKIGMKEVVRRYLDICKKDRVK